MKFGADVRRSQFDQTLYYNVSGEFTFNSTTENSVLYNDNYPGYLLGLDDSYTQGSAQREDIRNTGVYVFAQDSWKIKPSLTMNYGLRWELDTPLADALHHVQTFRPGQNSTVYPCVLTPPSRLISGPATALRLVCSPRDWSFLETPASLRDLRRLTTKPSPRASGLAYSPNPKTTIRGGWGLFYNPMEQLVLEQFGAEPPFGGSTSCPQRF
jgi:outer membrane receptor protein involved in Fe transport